MSTGEQPAGNRSPPSRLSGYDQFIPPDPLLRSGAFIDDALLPPQSASPLREEAEPLATPAADVANCSDEMRKSTDNESVSTRSGPTTPERPKWLPDDWRMVCRVRSSGATAGSIDRYYIEPVSGQRFRSKVEVEYFLQTGSKRKRKPTSDADANPSPGGRKQKKSGSKSKSPAPLNFDYDMVAENVRWVLIDAPGDRWKVLTDGKVVPESTRKDWNAAFKLSTTQ